MSIKALELGVQPSAPASPSSGKRKLFLNAQGKLCYKDHDGSVVQVGTTSYSDLSNVPASFPPSAHTHSYEELTSGPAEQGRVIAADGVGGFDLVELDAAAASYAVKVAPYTALAGDKIAADTSGGPWTLTLPSNPTPGDVIEVLDYSGQFGSKPLVIARNGQKIESLNEDLTCNVSGACFFLVFAGTIKGWQLVTTFSAGGGAGGGAGGVDWSELVGVPSLFPPEAHDHVAADISDFASAVEAVAPPTTDASLLTSGTLEDARLSTAVQTSLGKADTASQPGHTHELADLGDTADFINSKVQFEALLGSRYKGVYNNGADYNPGDVVSLNGVLYVRVGEANPGYPPGTTYWDTWELGKNDLGLSEVDNTSDVDKPISTATQSALDSKIDESLLGAANGVATLDAGGKLASTQIPDIAVSDYLGAVANEAGMLALTGQNGDWCSRTDLGTNWIITGSNPAQIGSWTQLSYPAAPVTSVNTKVGAVVIDKSDVGLGNVDNTSDANKPVSTATQTALNGKANTSHTHDGANITSGTVPKQRLPFFADARVLSITAWSISQQAINNCSVTTTTAHNLSAGDSVTIAGTSVASGSPVVINGTYTVTQVITSNLFVFSGPSSPLGTQGTNNGSVTINGLMSVADRIKLDGIQSGAEVNINADWNATSGDAQILNKPAIPAPSNASPTSLDTNPSPGTQSTYSRSDHVHPYPSASALGITSYDVQTDVGGDLATDLEVLYGYDTSLTDLSIPETINGLEVVNFTGPAQYDINGLFFYPTSRAAYNDPASYPIWRSEYTTKSPTGYFYIFSADSMQSVVVFSSVLSQTYGSNLATWYPTGTGTAADTTASTLDAVVSWDSPANQFGTFAFQLASRQRFTRHAAAQHSYFGYDPLQATDIRAAEELVESYTITQSLFDNYVLPIARSYRGTFTFAFNKSFTTLFAAGQTGDSVLLTVNGGTTGGTFNGVAIPAGQQRVFRFFASSTGWGNAPVLESLAIPIGSGGTGHSPVSNTSYFIADLRDLNPTVNASQRPFRLPAGVIHGLALTIYVGGTLGATAVGAGAVSSIALVDSAGLVVGSVEGNITTNLWGASQQTFIIANVNIPVVAGTNYSLRITTPTFTTAPTSVRYSGYLRFRREI